MAVGGPVHLVLDDPEEIPRHLGIGVVVDAGRVDVGNFLIEEPLAGANVADPGEQLLKVILAERATGLDPLIIQRKALDQKLGEAGCGPLAKRADRTR